MKTLTLVQRLLFFKVLKYYFGYSMFFLLCYYCIYCIILLFEQLYLKIFPLSFHLVFFVDYLSG